MYSGLSIIFVSFYGSSTISGRYLEPALYLCITKSIPNNSGSSRFACYLTNLGSGGSGDSDEKEDEEDDEVDKADNKVDDKKKSQSDQKFENIIILLLI